jgi:prepilin-type N-terminal cleavage/methylation domain-containing protein
VDSQLREQGFTLIETMVAMVIASVVLLAMGLFTLSVLRSDNLAKQQTVATHVAQQALEQWFSTNTAPSQTTTTVVNGTTYQFQSFDTPTPISGVSSNTLTGLGTNTAVRAITVYWRNASGVHKVTVTDMQKM